MSDDKVIEEKSKTANKVKPEFAARDVVLPRSKIKVTLPEDWHISDTQAAQRIAAGKPELLQLALFQRVCLFNGERWTIAQIEENINGRDYFELMGEFFGHENEEGEMGNP